MKSARESIKMYLRNIPKEPSFINCVVDGRGREVLTCKFDVDFSKYL